MAYAEFKRWMYRGSRPHGLARFLNRGFAVLHAAGIAPGLMVTLEVTGRRSGRTVSMPLVMLQEEKDRYLVSMLGDDVSWVRNVRAAHGDARLKHGRTEDVKLIEVPVERRAPLLKAYLRIAPGARPHVPVAKEAPVDQFEKIAPRFPVFRVETRAASG